MPLPDQLWNLTWVETYRDRPQERRYRNPARCARQLASILAAPDAIVRLRGIYVTAGWSHERNALEWRELDPATLLAEIDDTEPADDDTDEITSADRYRLIADAWSQHHQREGATT